MKGLSLPPPGMEAFLECVGGGTVVMLTVDRVLLCSTPGVLAVNWADISR